MPAPYGKRVVLLKGHPVIDEDGAAQVQINPGYMVKGVTQINLQNGTTTWLPRRFALERDELGTGIDATFVGVGTGNFFYASGDQVKVATMYPGCRFVGWVQSGVTLAADGLAESAGDGTLRALTGNYPVARALDAITATALSKVRFEAM